MRDLSNFNMFEPLDTDAKKDMAELALTQVEGILRDLMEDKKQELVFTRYQMEKEVELILTGGHKLPERRRAVAGRVRGCVETVLCAAQDSGRIAKPGSGRG